MLGALERAAEGHHFVAAVAPPRQLLRAALNRGAPPDIRDLLNVESAIVTVDQQREGKGMDAIERIKVNLTATYDDAKQAAIARQAANRLLAFGAAAVEASLDPVVQALATRLLAPLRGEPVRAEGRELRLPYEVEMALPSNHLFWSSCWASDLLAQKPGLQQKLILPPSPRTRRGP
jgi:hypothetical protein